MVRKKMATRKKKLTSKSEKSNLLLENENLKLKLRLEKMKNKRLLKEEVETLGSFINSTFPLDKWENYGDVNYPEHGGVQVKNGGNWIDLYNLSVAGYDGIAYVEDEGSIDAEDVFDSKYNVSLDTPISELSSDMLSSDALSMDHGLEANDIKGIIIAYILDYASYYGLGGEEVVEYDSEEEAEELIEELSKNLDEAGFEDCNLHKY